MTLLATKPPPFKRHARAPAYLSPPPPVNEMNHKPRVVRPTTHQQMQVRMLELPGGPRRLLGDAGPMVTAVFTDSPALAEWLGK